jgi:hypothetical protein
VSRRFRRYSPTGTLERQHVSYAKTVAEQFTSQCCFKCGCRTQEVYECAVPDPSREGEQEEQGGWKNDRMVRGYAFAIPNRGCLIDRTLGGYEHHGPGASRGRWRGSTTTPDTRDGGNEHHDFFHSRSSVSGERQSVFLPYSRNDEPVSPSGLSSCPE